MLEPLDQAVSKWKRATTQDVKYLPVLFIVSCIIGLYLIYTTCHCLPRFNNPTTHDSATIQLIAFHIITGLLVICYLLCLLVHPGTIPEKDEDPSWEPVAQGYQLGSDGAPSLQESKRSGDRRHCKWCAKYKPDRCHHCRICEMCILKMDHHCPWVYNCVGFRNHKFFFLLLFYTTIDCHLIVWTMADSVKAATDPSTPFMQMFLLLFGETLAIFFCILTTVFFGFHIFLMLSAMTTIELCEKATKRSGYDSSAYDRGFWGNIKAVLGENPVFWLCPWSMPEGNGLVFVTEDMRLTKDMEVGRGVRRRAHQRAETYVPKRRSTRPQGSAGTGSAPGSNLPSEDDDDEGPEDWGAHRPIFSGAARSPVVSGESGDQPALSPGIV